MTEKSCAACDGALDVHAIEVGFAGDTVAVRGEACAQKLREAEVQP